MSQHPNVVRIELFGIPRQRAGVAVLEVEARSLGEALERLGERLPRLTETCVTGGRLRPGYLASINGRAFTVAPETPLESGDAVLILSADAGG